MKPLEKVISFFGKIKISNITENFERFKGEYAIYSPAKSVHFHNQLKESLESFNSHSIEILITLKIDSYSPIRINSKNLNYLHDSLDEYDDDITCLTDSQNIQIILEIDKSNDERINIFDINKFFNGQNDIKETLTLWSKHLNEKRLPIILWQNTEEFNTRNLEFIYYKNLAGVKNYDNKELRKDKAMLRDKCCHFSNASEICLVPEDFIIEKPSTLKEINQKLETFANIISICYISNHSTLFDDHISYRLNGYKVLTGTLKTSDLKTIKNKELFSIYEWIYNDGNITDKIGIARNIASIHTNNDCFLDLQEGTANSIKSGYELYLKENVKQYIEIKNKISDFIHVQADKASELTKNMFNMFKTNIWTFSTFFIGVFLLRNISSNPEKTAFTFEVLLVSYVLIIVSFIYLLISASELNSDRDRLLKRYSDIRKRYEGLLDEKDLNSIIDHKKIKESEEKHINKKRNKYIIAWVAINIILASFVTFLYLDGKTERSATPTHIEEDID